MNKNIFDFFDRIYCINLPESKDRKQKVSEFFRELGILDRVKFDSAPRPPPGIVLANVKICAPGVLGVSLSNLKILLDAAHSNVKNFLVFEDDVETHISVNSLKNRLSKSIKELPNNWDVFYLGGKPKRKVDNYSTNLVKVNHMVGAYAYALNKKAIPLFSDVMVSEMYKYPFDGMVGAFAMRNNGYCVYPPIITTKPGHSVLRKKHRDYRRVTDESWKKMKPK